MGSSGTGSSDVDTSSTCHDSFSSRPEFPQTMIPPNPPAGETLPRSSPTSIKSDKASTTNSLHVAHSKPSILSPGTPNSAPTSPVHSSSTRRFKPVVREPQCDLHPLYHAELAELFTPDHNNVAQPRTQPPILLVDVRPYTMYSFTHIRSAISICIPSTLLKRQTFGFRKIMDFVAPQDVETLNCASQCSHIIFYDQFTSKCAVDSTLRRTAAKFFDADASLAPKLHWLVGGLAAVTQHHPHLIDAGEDLITSMTENLDDQAMLSRSSFGNGSATTADDGSTVPNPSSDETPRLTLSSVKAAPRSPFSLLPVVTAVGGGLGSPVNTPSRSRPPLDQSSSIHVEGEIAHRLPEFPRWLVDAVKRTDAGQNVLAEAFQRLQAAEIQRVTPGTAPREPRSAHHLSPHIRIITPRSTPSTPSSDSSLMSSRSQSSTTTSPMHVKQPQSQGSQSKQQSYYSNGSPGSNAGNYHNKQQHLLQLRVNTDVHDVDRERGELKGSTHSSPLRSTFIESRPQQQFVLVPGDDPRKNRYTNIAPFGYNRVLVRGSEYLNASYIRSRISPLQYIATQAPVPASFGDFWWCVYEQKVPLIVMLTALRTESGQVKGNKYWFDTNYDGLEVKMVEESVQLFEDSANNCGVVVRRIVLISPEGGQHNVVHLQYEDWPDLGCPADPNDVLRLVELKKQIMRDVDEASNVIVHCSAGCGRTGTFCTIDTVTDYLSRLSWEGAHQDPQDRVLDVVSEFREQRIAMVQNQRQLLLCYEAVMLWYLKQLEELA